MGGARPRRADQDQCQPDPGLVIDAVRTARGQARRVGMTNRDVAKALFISAKTVEANLTQIYRKLGIRSRPSSGG